MEKSFYYLAGPHKGTPEEELYRFETSLKLTAEFLSKGIYVFSPIVYGKQIAEASKYASVEERRSKVLNYLLQFLKASKGMILLTMDGWEKSWGVSQELACCVENHLPVYLMDPIEKYNDISAVLSIPLNNQQIAQLLKVA